MLLKDSIDRVWCLNHNHNHIHVPITILCCWHGPILSENFYEIVCVELEYTRILKMYKLSTSKIMFVPYTPGSSSYNLQRRQHMLTTHITMVPTIWNIKLIHNIFDQKRKLIEINNWQNIRNWGRKAKHSTLYCRISYLII